MPSSTEQQLEGKYINSLQSMGWTFVLPESLERESLEEPLLTQAVIRSIKRLANDERVGQSEITQAINELKLRGYGPEDKKKILNFIKFGIPVKLEKDRTIKILKLIDYENMQNNELVVSRQITHKRGEKQVRNDIILYVNGIPLVNIELKDPASPTESWATAFKDIEYYQANLPELYKYVQIGVAAAATAKYFPITDNPKPIEWKENEKEDIFDLLNPKKLLNILQNYLFIWTHEHEQTKVIARYMQYRTVEKISKRVQDRIEGKDKKQNGLIWHWQGSGKTLTMIIAANTLYQNPKLQNPSIFFIVDRDELEQQMEEEISALNIKVETIRNVAHLKEILEWDGGKGKKGMFLTLIHKFRPDELSQFVKEIKGVKERKNVICFIDEGHRTQYGDLAAVRKAIFKNAFSFAFTGTPIKKQNKNTYEEFSYPPEEKCLDKYFLKESQDDRFTLKMVYQPKLEKSLMYDRDGLEAFLKLEDDEIPEEQKSAIKDEIRRKLNKTKVVLENPERISKTAKDIFTHFRNIDGKFKGMIVATNKKTCVAYKRALDKLLPPKYSEVVMSYADKKDGPEVQQYRTELENHFANKDMAEINRKIKDDFKKKEYPKIVIVTDMLLAGYDAPILQTMYLIKHMKGNKLLQAIARTNRPYKDIKQAGLVVDYIGILREIDRAFGEYDEEDWQGSCQDIGQFKAEFERLIKQTLGLLEGVKKTKDELKSLNEAVRFLMKNAQVRQLFESNCKKLMGVYEMLASDEIKLVYYEDYKWLVKVYLYYQNTIEQTDSEAKQLSEKYFAKTLGLIHESTEIEKIRQDLNVKVLDKNYIEELEKRMEDSEKKTSVAVFDLQSFVKHTERHGHDPVVETIADKVEKIVQQWRDKTESMETIFQETKGVINEVRQLQSRKEKLGFSDFEYAMLISLESELKGSVLTEDVKELSNKLEPDLYHGWILQQTARKNIEREIRTYLRKYVKRYGMGLDEIEPLYQKIVENVKTYAAA